MFAVAGQSCRLSGVPGVSGRRVRIPRINSVAAARGGCEARPGTPFGCGRRSGGAWRLAARKASSKGGGATKGGRDDDLDISSFLKDIGDLEASIVEEEDQIVNVWNFDAETGQLVETQEVRKVRAKKRVLDFPEDDDASDDDEGGADGDALGFDGAADDDGASQYGWVKTRSLKVDGRDLEESIDYLATLSLDELDAESRAVIEEELDAKRWARCMPNSVTVAPSWDRPCRRLRPRSRPAGAAA